MSEEKTKGSIQISVKRALYDKLDRSKKLMFPLLPTEAISFGMVIEELYKRAGDI